MAQEERICLGEMRPGGHFGLLEAREEAEQGAGDASGIGGDQGTLADTQPDTTGEPEDAGGGRNTAFARMDADQSRNSHAGKNAVAART